MKAVQNTRQQPIQNPVTKDMIRQGLEKIGIIPNMVIEVHSSLSAFGYVIGGARTVVDALMEAAAGNGTILMANQTTDNSEPALWERPPVDPRLYQQVRDAMPPFDPYLSDTRGIGAVEENFRHREGVVISSHPAVSYAAWGKYARLLCNRQSLHFPLSEESPTARLYELKGYVLLLGTGFDTCTCMHLAEYRSDSRPAILQGACIRDENGEPKWQKYLDIALNSDDFIKVGEIMKKKGLVRELDIGPCHAMFFSAVSAIDEATHFFSRTQVYDLYR
jgi:aminoglycoside 3-N-acetyltransferase